MKLEPQNLVLGENEYIIGRLDMFQSLNLTRLAAPFLPVLFNDVFKNVIKSLFESKKLKEAKIDDVLNEISVAITVCEPVLIRFAQLPQDDFNTIIKTCLSCVERKQDKHWFKVMESGVLRFTDIDQYEVLNLCFRVIVRELRPIIAAYVQSAQQVA